MSEYLISVGHEPIVNKQSNHKTDVRSLAATITHNASKQTFYTIKYLVDPALVADAYRAYAYFRWVDDSIDRENLVRSERIAFVNRQKTIIERTFAGQRSANLSPQERLIVDLILNDKNQSQGLHIYIENMMAVMAFDAERRGRTITQKALNEYTRWLATAVTEAMHHFIGHDDFSPHDETRYLAVTAAHITHMLRDAQEDAAAGYFNIPQEFLSAHRLNPTDVNREAHRLWVQNQVKLARSYFQKGKKYMSRVENLRCRFAGFAYISRFKIILDAIEKDNYRLRIDYPERKTWRAAIKMGWNALFQTLKPAAPPPNRTTIEPSLAKESIS